MGSPHVWARTEKQGGRLAREEAGLQPWQHTWLPVDCPNMVLLLQDHYYGPGMDRDSRRAADTFRQPFTPDFTSSQGSLRRPREAKTDVIGIF